VRALGVRGREGGVGHTAVDVVVVPGAVVGDAPRRARLPALAADPVVDIVPADVVRATGSVVVVNRALVVGPERVEVPVVGALARLDAALVHLKRAGRDGGGEGREEAEEGERDHGEASEQNLLLDALSR
jgi:hypothetical protein